MFWGIVSRGWLEQNHPFCIVCRPPSEYSRATQVKTCLPSVKARCYEWTNRFDDTFMAWIPILRNASSQCGITWYHDPLKDKLSLKKPVRPLAHDWIDSIQQLSVISPTESAGWGERTMGSENFPLYHFFPMVVELHEFVTLRNTGL